MSHLMTKPTKWPVHPVKTQISLGIRPVRSESSLCTQWVAKDPSFLHVDSEDSDQTGQMLRLIPVFAERTCHFIGFVIRQLKWVNFLHLAFSMLVMFFIVFIFFTFYGPSTLFHSFWAKSIVRWGENETSPKKNTLPSASRTWLVSRDPRWAQTHSGEIQCL